MHRPIIQATLARPHTIVKRGRALMAPVVASFQLHSSNNHWEAVQDTTSLSTALDRHQVNLSIAMEQNAPS